MADTAMKFGYGNKENLDTAIENGTIDERDLVLTKDTSELYYIKDDNTKASGEWLRLSDATYWIDSNGYMATGWRQYNNGAWYYFKSSGAMAKNTWIEDNNKWFYLGGEGYMLKDTTVDGRYRLNSEGVWVQ